MRQAKNQSKLWAVAVLLLALCGLPAASQTNIISPKTTLPLRAAPPGAFFKGKGSQIGTAEPTEQYRILEQKSVPTIAGIEQWLRVEELAGGTKSGWIYSGTGGLDNSPTVRRR